MFDWRCLSQYIFHEEIEYNSSIVSDEIMSKISYPENAVPPKGYLGPALKELPNTILKSEVVTAMENHNTLLHSATPESLRQILIVSENTIVRSSQSLVTEDYISRTRLEKPEPEGYPACYEDAPAILFEHRASYCGLVLAFDAYGNAALHHEPLAGLAGDLEAKVELRNRLVRLKRFYYKFARADSMVLVTATNSMQGETEHQIGMLQETVNTFAPDRVEPLFINPRQSVYKPTSREEDITRTISDTTAKILSKDTALPPGVRDISGVIFVPEKLSQDGKNHVLVIDAETDMHGIQDTLFPRVE